MRHVEHIRAHVGLEDGSSNGDVAQSSNRPSTQQWPPIVVDLRQSVGLIVDDHAVRKGLHKRPGPNHWSLLLRHSVGARSCVEMFPSEPTGSANLACHLSHLRISVATMLCITPGAGSLALCDLVVHELIVGIAWTVGGCGRRIRGPRRRLTLDRQRQICSSCCSRVVLRGVCKLRRTCAFLLLLLLLLLPICSPTPRAPSHLSVPILGRIRRSLLNVLDEVGDIRALSVGIVILGGSLEHCA
mmetsp:Transcript_72726/g.151846  ORF Transcript_72726/g.151846 Transcript_72726/m.151846 type:complete len:243 (+) Transcript_72726:1219-1947(+)